MLVFYSRIQGEQNNLHRDKQLIRNTPNGDYGIVSEKTLNNIRESVNEYVEDEGKIPPVITLSQTRAVFGVMREMIMEAMEGKRSIVKLSPRATKEEREQHFETKFENNGGGDDNQYVSPQKFVSPQKEQQNRPDPLTPTPSTPAPITPQQIITPSVMEGTPKTPPTIKPSLIDPQLLEKQSLFSSYKHSAGKKKNDELLRVKKLLREKKLEVKSRVDEVNYQKDRIDFLVNQLKGGDSPGGSKGKRNGNVSPRSGDPAGQLKLAKRAYRAKMQQLKEAKEESKFLAHKKETAFQELLGGFELYERMVNGGGGGGEEEEEEEEEYSVAGYSVGGDYSGSGVGGGGRTGTGDYEESVGGEEAAYNAAQQQAYEHAQKYPQKSIREGFNRSGEWIR